MKDTNITFFDGEVPNEGDFVVHNFHGIGKCLGVDNYLIDKLSNLLDTIKSMLVKK